jgi:hypothetical protein
VLAPALFFLASSLPPGQIHDAIRTEADANQTYALYLPSSYDPAKTWPVLYGLDAGARGKLVVETFRDAAEKHGWIVAASNVSRNGPWNAIREATDAMVTDTRAHLRPRTGSWMNPLNENSASSAERRCSHASAWALRASSFAFSAAA